MIHFSRSRAMGIRRAGRDNHQPAFFLRGADMEKPNTRAKFDSIACRRAAIES